MSLERRFLLNRRLFRVNASLAGIAVGVTVGIFLTLGSFSPAFAHLQQNDVKPVSNKQNKDYIHEGIITGGDGNVNEVIVKDIRWASKSGFERVVLDFEGIKDGETLAVPRLPYYQLSATPETKQYVLYFSGHPKFKFEPEKIMSAFSKSSSHSTSMIEKLNIYPPLENAPWTIELKLKSTQVSVEVFQLSDPVRLILDIHPKKD